MTFRRLGVTAAAVGAAVRRADEACSELQVPPQGMMGGMGGVGVSIGVMNPASDAQAKSKSTDLFGGHCPSMGLD